MRVVIRVDASNLIGSGHVMRCLILAEMLAKDGRQVSFICRDLPLNLSKTISSRGFECKLLPFSEEQKEAYLSQKPNDNYDIWRGVSQEFDVEQTMGVISDKNLDLLIVDHYGIDAQWEKIFRPYVDKIMVIDDLANRKHDCDILLDHNYYCDLEARYDNLVPSTCKKLLGPKHALINPKLKQVMESRIKKGKYLDIPEKIENILVFLGGMDSKNYTDQVLSKALQESQIDGCLFNIVLGKNNPNKQMLKQKYAMYDNIVFHVQPSYYFRLLEQSDIAIGASGVAQLERLYIGLPSIIIPISENQLRIANDASSLRGVALLSIKILDSLSKLGQGKRYRKTEILEISCGIFLVENAINIITPKGGWFYPHAVALKHKMRECKLSVNLLSDHKLLPRNNYITFYLSYPKIVPHDYLQLSFSNVVVHASDLPMGKGWSPWVWGVTEGKDDVTLSLFEVIQELDAGPVYMKEGLHFEGNELLDEIRIKLSEKICEMCLAYSQTPQNFKAKKQVGTTSFYRKRNSLDSKINPNKTIVENFNLLRVVDNDAYPAFFDYKGCQYKLMITKTKVNE